MTDGVGDPRRLAALAESGLVDGPPEAAFDRVTRLVAEVLHVPVALFSAVRDQGFHFHELHESDGARIEQKRLCAEEDVEVPFEEIGRHRIEVRAGDAVLGSSPFTVNLMLRQQPGNA